MQLKSKMSENLRIDRHRLKNRSESKFSWIFQQPMNRDKYAYVFLWVEYFWEQVPAFLKSHPGRVTNKKTRRITVSVFPRTFELTALLFKKKILRLHCNTVKCMT